MIQYNIFWIHYLQIKLHKDKINFFPRVRILVNYTIYANGKWKQQQHLLLFWRSYTKKSIMKAFSYIQRMSIGSGLTIGDRFWLTMNGDLSGCANTWTENCLALQLYIWGLVRLCKFHERRNVRMDIMTISTEDGFCATYIYFMKGLKSTISFLDGGAFDRIPLLVKWSTKTHTFGVCFWTK